MFPPFIIEQKASARKWKNESTPARITIIIKKRKRRWRLLGFKSSYLPCFLCHSPQFPAPVGVETNHERWTMQVEKNGEEMCVLQTKQWHHTVDHTLSPFPPHLDLAWFNPLAELKEGSFCFVYVVQHHKTLPGDVLAAQDFLYLLAQGRRIRHILVVLRDLPTQDHMAAAVHLEGKQRVKGQRACKWKREEALQNLQPPLLIFCKRWQHN